MSTEIIITAIIMGALIFLIGIAVGILNAQESLNSKSSDAEGDLLLSLERVLRGDIDSAFELLASRARGRDAPPTLYFALAALLRRKGFTERSAQIHRILATREGLSRELALRARIGLAADYLNLGRVEDAEKLIKELPRKIRKQEGLLILRQRAALEAGDLEEALEATELQARNDDKQGAIAMSQIYSRIGEEAYENGQFSAAIRAFRKALRRDPTSIRARQGLVRVHLSSGKASKARKHLYRILEQNPSTAPIVLPQLFSAMGYDAHRYSKLLNELMEDEEAAIWAALEQADLLYEENDIAGTFKMLRELLENFPNSFEVHDAFLNFLVETNQEDEAIRHLDLLLGFCAQEIKQFRCERCGYFSNHAFLECPNCLVYGRASYLGTNLSRELE